MIGFIIYKINFRSLKYKKYLAPKIVLVTVHHINLKIVLKIHNLFNLISQIMMRHKMITNNKIRLKTKCNNYKH